MSRVEYQGRREGVRGDLRAARLRPRDVLATVMCGYRRSSGRPVPVGASTLTTRIDIDWGAMSAAGTLAAVRIVVFALIVQRHLVRGLPLGAVK
jgi:ABC-type glycerol-3-phosphate transport system permease component